MNGFPFLLWLDIPFGSDSPREVLLLSFNPIKTMVAEVGPNPKSKKILETLKKGKIT